MRIKDLFSSLPKGHREFRSTAWFVTSKPWPTLSWPSRGWTRSTAQWAGEVASIAQASNQGRIFIHLVPIDKRKPAAEIVQELRPKLATIPGINAYPQILPTIRIGGQLTKSQYQFTLQSPDAKQMYEFAPKLETALKTDPASKNLIQDVTSDLLITNPQVNVDIDRDKASALGLTANQIEDALFTAYGPRQISTIYAPSNTIPGRHATARSVPDGSISTLAHLRAIEEWTTGTA